MKPRHTLAALVTAIAGFGLAAPAGALANVDVTLSGGTLHVTSDGASSTLTMIDHYDYNGSYPYPWNGYEVDTGNGEPITSSDGSCGPDPNSGATDPQHEFVCLTSSAASLVQVDLGDGNDLITNIGYGNLSDAPAAPPAHIDGGNGNDDIQDGNGDDVINGGPGDDQIDADSGYSWAQRGEGNDTMDGGPGNDVMGGGLGDDTLTDTNGTDQLFGGDGNDNLNAGDGAGGDVVGCNDGTLDVGTGDAGDTIYQCETVHRPAASSTGSTGSTSTSSTTTTGSQQTTPSTTSTGGQVVASVAGTRSQSIGRQGGLILTGSCPGGCVLFGKATVSVPKLAKVYRFGSAKVTVAPGATGTLKLKLPKAAAKAVKKALRRHKKLVAKVTITATSGGKSTTYTTSVKLKP